MARGAVAKEYITNEILKAFEGSFLNGKEVRIPVMEDSELVQIKVTLTCAKENVENPNEVSTTVSNDTPANDVRFEVTPEEKQEVIDLMKAFNL